MIGIIDPDTVDATNLQRQVLYSSADEGRPKVEAARERLVALNPDIRVEAFQAEFDSSKAESLLREFDLVVDGSDNFKTRFLVNDAAYKMGIPLVFAAVDRFEGQVALFDGRTGPCYRCLYPEPPRAVIRNCQESGVLGTVVGSVGMLQAHLALQCLISGGDSLHPLSPVAGRLTLIDLAKGWNLSTVQIPKRPDCPTCSVPPQSIVLESHEESTSPACFMGQAAVTAHELATRLDRGGDVPILVDVRTDEEWEESHIPGAIHWELSRLEQGLVPPNLGRETLFVVYCRSGVRSARAVELFRKRGFKGVSNLKGGIESWRLQARSRV
jgi:adenylyltransferase/sulfurtransferase